MEDTRAPSVIYDRRVLDDLAKRYNENLNWNSEIEYDGPNKLGEDLDAFNIRQYVLDQEKNMLPYV